MIEQMLQIYNYTLACITQLVLLQNDTPPREYTGNVFTPSSQYEVHACTMHDHIKDITLNLAKK